jgi:hypothetical protein
MQTKVDATVLPHPEDAKLSAWLEQHEISTTAGLTMYIGIRSPDGRIYRRITTQSMDEFLKCMRFLELECHLTRELQGSSTGGGLDAIYSDHPKK